MNVDGLHLKLADETRGICVVNLERQDGDVMAGHLVIHHTG